MAHHKVTPLLILLLSILPLSACQQIVSNTQLQVLTLTHTPGEHLVASYEETDKKYNCFGNPVLHLVDSSFMPDKMVPGARILNTFSYASCAQKSIPGTIIRQVTHDDKVILQDVTQYIFVPGTWAVNAYLQIPPDAAPGAYVFVMNITAGRQEFKRIYPFQILTPQ